MRSAWPSLVSVSALLAVIVGSAAGSAAAATSVQVQSSSQGAVLEAGVLRVRVASGARTRVRVTARTSPAAGTGAPVRLTAGRTTTFTRAGARTLGLKLTSAGRQALAGCGDHTVVATAAASRIRRASRRRASRRRAGRRRATRRAPAFTGAVRTKRDSGTLRGDPEGCYTVGTAARLINPDPDGTYAGKPVYLGGYGIGSGAILQGRKATGFLDDGIRVRAFVAGDGKRSFASADIEAQGWFVATKDGPYGLVDMRKQVEEATGGELKASEVFIQSDHSHGGIDAIGVWGGMPVEYRAYIVERTVEAIVAAYRSQRPGTLHYGTAPAPDLLSNQFGEDAQNQTVDSDIRVMQARDGDGRPFATLLNFSAHTTVLGSGNTKATGDWVQEANRLLEERYGGEAVTLVATLGRTQPADRGCPDKSLEGDPASLCSLGEYATRVVARAADALAAAEPITGEPVVAAQSYLVEDVTSNAILLGLLIGGDNPVFGAPLNRSLTPPWLTGNVLSTVTGTARIGDILVSSMPGEAYPQIPLTVSSIVKPRSHMTMGLSNDQLGYLIAPFPDAYGQPVCRSFLDNCDFDELPTPDPISNDNYFFNVSHTMGERVICSLLRGADGVFGKAEGFYRDQYPKCAAFPNDQALAPGADTD